MLRLPEDIFILAAMRNEFFRCISDGSGAGTGDPWSSGGQLQSGPYTGYGSSASLLSGAPAPHLSQVGFPPPTMHIPHDPMVSMTQPTLAVMQVRRFRDVFGFKL